MMRMLTAMVMTVLLLQACHRSAIDDRHVLIAAFNDNGAMLDSLQKKYQCEGFSIDTNTHAPADSVLSFFIVNAKKMPDVKHIRYNPLVPIAKALSVSLKRPEQYKEFEIVFVAASKGLSDNRSSQFGGIIPVQFIDRFSKSAK